MIDCFPSRGNSTEFQGTVTVTGHRFAGSAPQIAIGIWGCWADLVAASLRERFRSFGETEPALVGQTLAKGKKCDLSLSAGLKTDWDCRPVPSGRKCGFALLIFHATSYQRICQVVANETCEFRHVR